MPVPLFASRPDRCPFGHPLTTGAPQRVGWRPCLCAPAREAAEAGRGMGHLWIWCIACDDEGREATFYEPPHDIAYQEPGAWRSPGSAEDGLELARIGVMCGASARREVKQAQVP